MNHLQDAMRVAHKTIWPLVRGQFGGCLESHLATGNDGTERPMATLQKSSTFINHWSPGYELYVNIMPLFYTSIYQSLYIGVCVYIKYLYIYTCVCVFVFSCNLFPPTYLVCGLPRYALLSFSTYFAFNSYNYKYVCINIHICKKHIYTHA